MLCSRAIREASCPIKLLSLTLSTASIFHLAAPAVVNIHILSYLLTARRGHETSIEISKECKDVAILPPTRHIVMQLIKNDRYSQRPPLASPVWFIKT